MSSDEDDYMSDKLLGNFDVRPGLVCNKETQRQLTIDRKIKELKTNKPKPLAVIQKEKRDEGLKTALNSDNKGFKLLEKMGYKPGQSLGKSDTGIVEPIQIQMKSNRGGLGRESDLEMKKKLKVEELKKRLEVSSKSRKILQDEFVSNFRNKTALRKIKSDLHKSKRACETLDKQKDIEVPEEKWFWIQYKVETDEDSEEKQGEESEEKEVEEKEEEKEEEEELPEPEQLEVITRYLRSKHFYCIWCGTTYEDERDMKEECPGDTSEDH